MDIQYVGEHLIPGHLGHFSIIAGFLTALLSAWFYFRSAQLVGNDKELYRRAGRLSFYAHSFFIVLSSFMLMFILLNRYYEYRYVWVHAENDLGLGYLIASFWAGQEGSLLFWTLCQVVVGVLLIRYIGIWENTVMTVVSVSQFFMVALLLGVNLFGLEIGMSPFVLLRELPENATSEFFQNPDYLSLITDGNGLNPLLRNFWMLSHPPVLFIGFALTLAPFAFALAGLWRKDYLGWIRISLPWTNLAVFFLGAGILLGGVWAYESLTFGGFWAWDPIENASLVPWLILVGALHLMLVAKNKQENIFPAYLFTFLAFVFVIYCTYLTRSGLLAETSVHSFSNDGTGWQILIYLLSFLIISVVVLLFHYKKLPSKENEQPLSKEFWLFIAAMVMVLSAFQIIFTTSIPVWNTMFGTELSPPVDVINHYNTWQLPFAVLVALLMALAHFLKWGKTDLKKFGISVSFSLALALVFTVILVIFTGNYLWAHRIFLFAGMFALFSSLDMLFRFRKILGNTPALISHLGMALFFVAVVLTFSQKDIISINTSGYNLGEGFPANENQLLIKGEIVPLGSYYASYLGNFREGEDLVYEIDFLKKNDAGEYYKVFTSRPTIKLNETMGNVYNPYAKVYPLKDIFTYITFADIDTKGEKSEPELLERIEITRGDTVTFQNNKLLLTAIDAGEPEEGMQGAISVTASIELLTHFGAKFTAQPRFMLNDMQVSYKDDIIEDLDLSFRFAQVGEKPFTIFLEVYRHQPDFIIIRSIIFPYINLLWLSCIVMLVGFWMSYRKRWKTRQ